MAGLYHYTTGAGLLGMLKDYSKNNPNLTMWATHYMYMNDPKEYIYGQEICLDIIDEIEEELKVEKRYRIKTIFNIKALQKAFNMVDIKYGAFPDMIGTCPYFSSFSEAEDSLHMWNMYATNGNGISMRFNRKKIGEQSHYNIEKCVYYNEKSRNKIKNNVELLYNNLNSSNSSHDKIRRAFYIASGIYLKMGVCIKNSAYKGEKETRLIAQSADKVLFRDKNGLIIPYVEQKIPFDCVEKIIVGPTADFEMIRNSILLFLNSKGIDWDENKIEKSRVPYRE